MPVAKAGRLSRNSVLPSRDDRKGAVAKINCSALHKHLTRMSHSR